MANKGVKA